MAQEWYLTTTLSYLSESIRRQGAWVCEALFSPGPLPRTPLMFGSGKPDSSCWWGWTSQSPDTHPSPTMQFNNLGRKKLPISVVFWIPIQLNKVTVWSQPQVTFTRSTGAPQPRPFALPRRPPCPHAARQAPDLPERQLFNFKYFLSKFFFFFFFFLVAKP